MATQPETSEPQFTPGPWHVVMHGQAAYVSMFIGKEGLPSSATGDAEFSVQPYCRKPQAVANANLIAAAPDLYAALAALLDGRPTEPPRDAPKESVAYKNWMLFEQGRVALRKALVEAA